MRKKIQHWHWVVAVIVLLAALAFFHYTTKREPSSSVNTPAPAALDATGSGTGSPSSDLPKGIEAPPDVELQGILSASDQPQQGDIMLLSNGRKFYFHTQTDYSKLYGKRVLVEGTGSPDDFQLDYIVEAK